MPTSDSNRLQTFPVLHQVEWTFGILANFDGLAHHIAVVDDSLEIPCVEGNLSKLGAC